MSTEHQLYKDKYVEFVVDEASSRLSLQMWQLQAGEWYGTEYLDVPTMAHIAMKLLQACSYNDEEGTVAAMREYPWVMALLKP